MAWSTWLTPFQKGRRSETVHREGASRVGHAVPVPRAFQPDPGCQARDHYAPRVPDSVRRRSDGGKSPSLACRTAQFWHSPYPFQPPPTAVGAGKTRRLENAATWTGRQARCIATEPGPGAGLQRSGRSPRNDKKPTGAGALWAFFAGFLRAFAAPGAAWTNSWCRRRDSNSHSFRHYPLKIACLPISPRRHLANFDQNPRILESRAF